MNVQAPPASAVQHLQQADELSADLVRMSIGPEDQDEEGGSSNTRGQAVRFQGLPPPSGKQKTYGSGSTSYVRDDGVPSFQEINEESEDVDMERGRQPGPSTKRKRPEDRTPPPAHEEVFEPAAPVVKGAKRRQTAEPPTGSARRPSPRPSNIRIQPPCERCVEKGLSCVQQKGGGPKPLPKACFECARTRHKCLQGGVPIRITRNKKKSAAAVVDTQGSEEDELPEGTSAVECCHCII